MVYLLYDVAIVAIVLFFLWRGISKGFILSLCGLLAVVVAFVGASFLAGVLSPKVGDILEPQIAQVLEEQLTESIQHNEYITDQGGVASVPDEVPLGGVLDVLREMGLYDDLVETIESAVEGGMANAAVSAAAAVAAQIAQSVAYTVIFLIGFILVLIAWTILAHALDLVSRLPVLHQLNRLGGGAIGLVKAVIVLFLAAWALRFAGNLIPAEAVEQTYLLKFFMTTNPIKLILGA